MNIKNQLRSVIQWTAPQEWQLFYQHTADGDEIKDASTLILQPGQGCLYTHEGQIQGQFDEAGAYELATSNKPFITSLTKVLNAFESDHKVAIWFYRATDIVNIRWGTRIPIKYTDPVYGFPVHLRAYGNYSIRITAAEQFFREIVFGRQDYYAHELQELFLSRITQPISNYLANAKFSYAEIDSRIEEIAAETMARSQEVFTTLGFKLRDFRIEGTSFDEETNKRIDEISDVQADVKAAGIAGVDFAELQKLKAMRDAAKNEGAAGMGLGMMTGMNLHQQTAQPSSAPHPADDLRSKLQALKNLHTDGLITEEEYAAKRQALLDSL